MARKYIELADGRIRDVNSVEQMYQLQVSRDSGFTKKDYFFWDEAAAAYREALSNPDTNHVELYVYGFEFALEGKDFKELED